MPAVTVRVEGLKPVQNLAERLGTLQAYKAGLLAAGEYIKAQVAVYPPASQRSQPFVSAQQRRGFFARLQAGDIEVPYRRGLSPASQKLGQSWNVRADRAGLAVTVGTAVKYAQLVQGGAELQATYHAVTGWKRADQVMEAHGERAVDIVRRVVELSIR